MLVNFDFIDDFFQVEDEILSPYDTFNTYTNLNYSFLISRNQSNPMISGLCRVILQCYLI
jgi:hypothetical protein